MASRRSPGKPPRGGLRVATARGGVVNAAFLSGAEGLVLLQGLLATALLGPDAIGLYGVVTTTAMTIVALRRVGIDEAFVQEEAVDEEAEFQRAFTVELALGLTGALAIAALAPLLAAAYDAPRLLALTLAVAYLPVAFALQAPQWVFFKRMDYVRLRLLQVIVPLGTVLVTVPLLLAGAGVWALVIGPLCGNAAAVLAAWRASPYPLRLRPERAAARRYLRFSWPVFVTAAIALAVAQGQIAVFGVQDGLVAAGWITLAATLTRYVDRADQILATTIYPAIVRVRDRAAVLEELFEKANRLTLMWAFPFGAGLALFGADLVRFVLGDEWEGAIVLLGGLAVAGALQQVGYNWFAFYRARGESWPQAVEAGVLGASFAAFAVPGALLGGAWWFVAGRLACTACVLAVRRIYVRRLLPGVRLAPIALRAAVPVALASAPVLAVRLALWGGDRSLAQALAELTLWFAGLALATRRLESGLLAELRGYLRPRTEGAPVASGGGAA
jgi:O-antigen/teichoic acid export membrane protein